MVVRRRNIEEEQHCPFCRHTFVPDSDDVDLVCPSCGKTQEVPDMEEVHLTRQDGSLVLQVKLQEKAKQQASTMGKLYFENRKALWEDTAKEQLSLEKGSDGYADRIEDLEASDPMQPDDPMHQRLEDYNEDLVTKLYEKAEENPQADDEAERNAQIRLQAEVHEEQLKRSIHTEVVRAAIAAAAKTPTLSDDQLARAITTDNPALYDDSISFDQYDDAIMDYVMEPSK